MYAHGNKCIKKKSLDVEKGLVILMLRIRKKINIKNKTLL
jgi:hypothetical protein